MPNIKTTDIAEHQYISVSGINILPIKKITVKPSHRKTVNKEGFFLGRSNCSVEMFSRGSTLNRYGKTKPIALLRLY